MGAKITLRRLFSAMAIGIGGAVAAAAQAELAIAPGLSKTSIDANEAGLAIYVSGFNDGAPVTVDVYLAVQLPNGSFYSFRGRDWSPGIKPWLADVSLPRNFSYPSTLAVKLPGLGAGRYTVYTAFARPGTLDLLHVSQAPFIVAGATGGIRFGALTLTDYTTYDPGTGGQRRASGEAEAGGAFISSNKSLEFTRGTLEGYEPALGQCVLNKLSGNPFALPGGLQYQTLDVGDAITLQATERGAVKGSINLVKDPDLAAFGQNVYGLPSGATLPNPTIKKEYQYAFSAPGGSQLGAFTATAAGMDRVRLDTPKPATFNDINSSADLNVDWDSGRGIGEVFVSISGVNAVVPFPDSCSLDCRFVDDGAASVPSAQLRQLRSCISEGSFPGAGRSVDFTIERNRYQFFNTVRNELGFGVVVLDSGVSVRQVNLN